MFEKEEHYEILSYLERVFLDLFENNIFLNDEHKTIGVFFRMTVIENYVKKLPKIKMKSFYDYKHKCKNPFEIRFPNLTHLEHLHYSEVLWEIWEFLEDLEMKELEYKFLHLGDLINDRINVKYYK